MKPSRTRALGALAVAALAFVVYLRTMYPGLVMFGDSPKFQFVGRIWGTPHNPGYPLYIVVSHVFGLLPIGTLAYRINLMSAVFGAIAAGLLALLVARLTRSAWAGVAAGLGLAFGRVFWSQALVAEVYTLATALLIATTFFAVKWTETRRERDLLLAILFAAIAVGNHLTIVMFAPGLVVLVLLTDWRAALRPRTLLIGAGLIAAGLAQYLLLIYLTRRGAPYLESAPRNLSELIPVVAGAEFQGRFGHFGWRELFTSRSARLLGILVDETTMWGAGAAAAGLIILLRRRPAIAAGLLLGGAGVWAFILDYDIADPQVFLVPVFVVLWIFAGVAAGAAVDLASRAGRIPAAMAGIAAALVAGSLLYGANRRANDHHGRTYETDVMNAIFLTLPTRAIVVWSAFSEQLLLQYKVYGERAGADRAITEHGVDATLLKEAFAREQPVYALAQAPRSAGAVRVRLRAGRAANRAANRPRPVPARQCPGVPRYRAPGMDRRRPADERWTDRRAGGQLPAVRCGLLARARPRCAGRDSPALGRESERAVVRVAFRATVRRRRAAGAAFRGGVSRRGAG